MHGDGSFGPAVLADLKNALEAVGQSCHTAARPVSPVSLAKNTCAWEAGAGCKIVGATVM
jgi:hypothetical protein